MNITRREARYIKIIYQEIFEKNERVTSGVIAKIVKVRTPTVTEALKKMEKKRLLKLGKHGEVELTKKGVAVAERIIRNHRILETYFVRVLGLDLAYACKECSNIDYLISEELQEKFSRALGNPCKCPHGKPIPSSIAQGDEK